MKRPRPKADSYPNSTPFSLALIVLPFTFLLTGWFGSHSLGCKYPLQIPWHPNSRTATLFSHSLANGCPGRILPLPTVSERAMTPPKILTLLTTSPGAFLSALIVGVALHYHKIVENEYYGYPDEWFPSVSATIGDRYPERSFFMLFIAITSGMECKICIKTPRLTGCRSSFCSRRFVVPPHGSTQFESPQVRGWYGRIQNSYMRWLDVCHFNG